MQNTHCQQATRHERSRLRRALTVREFTIRENAWGRAGLLIFVILLTLAPGGCRAIRRRVANNNSIDARRMSREGLAAIHQDKWDEAEELFETALGLSKTDERAYLGYGEVLWHKGQREEAIESVEKAVRLSAEDPQLHLRLGNMYLEEGSIDKAEKVAKRVLNLDHSLAAAWALEGDILVKQQKFDDALAAYHRAIAIDQQNEAVRHAIAQLYLHQKRYDRSLATLDQVNEEALDTERLASVEFLRGIAMRQLGRPSQASVHLARAVSLGKQDTDTLFEYANTEYLSGRVSTALEVANQSLRLNPQNQNTLQLLSEIKRKNMRLAGEFGSEQIESLVK